MLNGTISKFWDNLVCPFVCMFVCVYKVGRYQRLDGVPFSVYCVYSPNLTFDIKCTKICCNVGPRLRELMILRESEPGFTKPRESFSLICCIENPWMKEATSVESDSPDAATDLERLEDLLVQKWTEKISRAENDFVRRFPRDQYRSSAAASVGRILKNLPKPLKTDLTSTSGK